MILLCTAGSRRGRLFSNHLLCGGTWSNLYIKQFRVGENAALVVASHVLHHAGNSKRLVALSLDFLFEYSTFLEIVEIHFEIGVKMRDVFALFRFSY